MKKLIAVIMTMVMLMGVAACDKEGLGRGRRSGETETKYDIEKLQTYEGPMLEITSTIRAPLPDDMERDHTLYVNYDGRIFIPHNPITESGVTIDDDDYMDLYNFCVESVENDTFADYSELFEDGVTYRFVFYDEDGHSHLIYDGYIYNNEELLDIVDIVAGYEMD